MEARREGFREASIAIIDNLKAESLLVEEATTIPICISICTSRAVTNSGTCIMSLIFRVALIANNLTK